MSAPAARLLRRALYHPDRRDLAPEVRRAEHAGLRPWHDADGALIGWTRPNPAARHRLVVVHGNAGSALDRAFYVDAFGSLGGGTTWEVFLLEYPGYGARTGVPGDREFLHAARTAVEQGTDERPVHLLGESIGSGTASALAGTAPELVAGVALVIPFARMREVVHARAPYAPSRLLVGGLYDNIGALAHYGGPVAVVVAEHDEVVGPEQGRRLYAAHAGPKLLVVLPGAGHGDVPQRPDHPWYAKVSAFLLAP
jgi:pimeloyl-ACP methyl ester carboxylesterase